MKKISLQIFAFFCAAVIVGCHKSDPDPKPVHFDYLVQVVGERHLKSGDIIRMIEDEFDVIPEEYMEMIEKYGWILIPDVTVAKILYKTPDHDGKIVNASGVVVYRTNATEYDHIVSVQHGTCQICDPPSEDFFPVECATVVTGDVVCMADYLGYGATQNDSLYHPYIHHGLTASTCYNMFRAAEEYMTTTALMKTGNDIRLFGYSQGGAATVSTLMKMEEEGLGPRIKDVRVGGCPFDLNVFFEKYSADSNVVYSEPAYILMLTRGLFYGDNLLDSIDWHDILADDMFDRTRWYDNKSVFDHFPDYNIKDMNHKLDTLCEKKMGYIYNKTGFDKTATPENEFKGNKSWMTFYEELQRHSLVKMQKPGTPIKVYHCVVDPKVPRECGELGARWLGVTINDIQSQNHRNGAVYFMLEYAEHFDPQPLWPFSDLSWRDLEEFIED
ncbi:MAG: hypothetical protein MJY44_04885 [Bacteroidales bacterium]|nr:hypothetical protein [Bacteroidales bacterium]